MLAALHFNENSNQEQAVSKKGEERYDIVFPKYKKGSHIVRKVLTGPTYGNCIQKNTTETIRYILYCRLHQCTCESNSESM